MGYCHPLSAGCKALGVMDNMCGKCTALPGGGFQLEETSAGLRYAGASFDDNQIGTGSYQAMNICILARYGNGGKIAYMPTNKCGGHTGRGPSSQVHWYGNCRMGSKETTCCSNAALLKSGFDWTKFARGNSCRGDNDKDRVLDQVKCYFETTPALESAETPMLAEEEEATSLDEIDDSHEVAPLGLGEVDENDASL